MVCTCKVQFVKKSVSTRIQMLLWGLGCFHDLSLLQIWRIEAGVGGPWQCFIACLALLQVACHRAKLSSLKLIACRREFSGWEITFLFGARPNFREGMQNLSTSRSTKHQVGVSKNRGAPKWMVYNGKPY